MAARILITREQLRELRLVADEWAAKSRGCDDSDLAHTYREDGRALLEVADALECSEISGARRLVDELDTAVRDLIPSSLYRACGLRGLRTCNLCGRSRTGDTERCSMGQLVSWCDGCGIFTTDAIR